MKELIYPLKLLVLKPSVHLAVSVIARKILPIQVLIEILLRRVLHTIGSMPDLFLQLLPLALIGDAIYIILGNISVCSRTKIAASITVQYVHDIRYGLAGLPACQIFSKIRISAEPGVHRADPYVTIRYPDGLRKPARTAVHVSYSRRHTLKSCLRIFGKVYFLRLELLLQLGKGNIVLNHISRVGILDLLRLRDTGR